MTNNSDNNNKQSANQEQKEKNFVDAKMEIINMSLHIKLNFGTPLVFSRKQHVNHSFMTETNLYIVNAIWQKNATPIPIHQNTFGHHMTFAFNRPIELQNQQIKLLDATFIECGTNKIVYKSDHGFVIKIEPITFNKKTFRTSLDKEYYLQQNQKPTGISPITHMTPFYTTTKIHDRSNETSTHCVACIQQYVPFIVKKVLRKILFDAEITEKRRVQTFVSFFATIYVNFVFQTILNLKKLVVPIDCNLNNLAFDKLGLVSIDFEQFLLINYMPLQHQARKICQTFDQFFSEIFTLCHTANFHLSKIRIVLRTLRQWTQEMCEKISNNSLHKTWKAPMFSNQLIDLLMNTFIDLFPPSTNSIDHWPEIRYTYTTP